VAAVVESEQGFLHEILHFVRGGDETAPEVGAQVRAASRQERRVRFVVACQREEERSPQRFFDVFQLLDCYSIAANSRLQGAAEKS